MKSKINQIVEKQILIVDDIFSNRLLLSSALEGLGVYSKSVTNGQEAIDVLSDKEFDMVLLDIEMPVMNGIETVEHIRNEMPEVYKKIPIVAITAHSMTESRQDLINAGFNEVFSKPYSIERLAKLIDKYCQTNYSQ